MTEFYIDTYFCKQVDGQVLVMYLTRCLPNERHVGSTQPAECFVTRCGLMIAGVIHGAELFYLSGFPLKGHSNFRYDESDKHMAHLLLQLWSNFVKNG